MGERNKDIKIVTNVYAALTVSLLLSFIPVAGAALLATILFLGVWITSYVLRARADQNSLTENHMTFIIRTIWIAGLFSLFTIGAASAYLLSLYDPSPLYQCTGNLNSTDTAALIAAVQPCVDRFVQANMMVFINATLIAAGPLVIYLGYRLFKGLARGIKGHRIGDTKSWF